MAEEQIQKPETNEIATAEKDIDIFSGWINRLENPDPVLRTESQGKGLKLYDEVSRDAHAGSVLQTRYLSVVGKEWNIESAQTGASRGRPRTETQEQKIADFVKETFLGCNFDQARQELLQGILYGFYVGEVIWKYANSQVRIEKIRAKHPRRFSFTANRELRLLTFQNMIEGEPVPERKFIVYTYGSSDNPYGKGLGQMLWWPVWFKKHGIKFWMLFCEKFGSPTPVGKYPPGTKISDQNLLLAAIEALQQETGVVIPDGMKIDLLEAQRAGTINTYESLCSYMDKQISKAVLGQTATTEGTPGKLGNEDAQNKVRTDIVKADADLLCECINNTLIPWLVDFNFPGVMVYPKIWIRTEEEKDLKPLADRDKIIVTDIGVPVGKQYFYDTYNIPKPEEGEEVVNPKQSVQQSGEPPAFSEFADEKKTLETEASLLEAQEKIDALADNAILDALPLFENYIEKITSFINEAKSLESLCDHIVDLYTALPSGPLAEHLARQLISADRIGIESVAGNSEFAEAIWGPGLPFEEAIDYFKAKSFTIAGVAKADLLAEVKGELVKTMEQGFTLKDFQSSLSEMFTRHGYTRLSPYRVDTIFRTNIQGAYQAGRYRQMTDPAVLDARPYWRYVAVLDASTRPEHAALNGKVFPAKSPFWQTWYPPNGFNCRCTVQTISKRELDKNGWTVETSDPTGKLFEPVDPVSGNKMPARMLMPDQGWGARPATLERLLEDKQTKNELAKIAWAEVPGQPGPKELNRPVEKAIAAAIWEKAPEKSPDLKTIIKNQGLTESGALNTIETEYKQIMGISPNETAGALKGPDGEVIKVNIDSLAYTMLDRKSGCERYIPYFRKTIEDPYEIILAEYQTTGGGKTKFRKKYIGLFRDENNEGVIIIAEESPEGWEIFNMMNAKTGTIDRQRRGRLVLYGK